MENADSNPPNSASKLFYTYAPWGFLGLACCAAPMTLIIYLFVFAWYNPDNLAWVGITKGGEYQMFGSEREAEAALAADVQDIHYDMQFWFSKGFFLHTVIPCIIVGFTGLSYRFCN